MTANTSVRPLRIMMMGLRGFPGVQGGIETHAEQLAQRLVELGCRVDVLVRTPYQPKQLGRVWRGVRFRRIWAPKSKTAETIIHSLLCVLYAGWARPDVLHIHAIGPAIVTPLARMLGLKVVVTHHGPDYERQKWGGLAKLVLQFGEWVGMRFSSARIVISPVIENLVRGKHDRECFVIPNGVVLPELPTTSDVLNKFGLEVGRYILMVSRLVPEKRHGDLIAAFRNLQLNDWKLVLVGGSDHPDRYERRLRDLAASCPGVVMTGFQTGLPLRELYAHAGLFVLPSTHEGLPIALLEALSFGLAVVASDIPANLSVGLPIDHYFKTKSVSSLAKHILAHIQGKESAASSEAIRMWVCSRYDWSIVSAMTLDVYRGIQGLPNGGRSSPMNV